MARKIASDGYVSMPIVEGQPRGMSGPSDVALDGNIIGRREGFCRATGREKQSTGDFFLDRLNGKRTKKA